MSLALVAVVICCSGCATSSSHQTLCLSDTSEDTCFHLGDTGKPWLDIADAALEEAGYSGASIRTAELVAWAAKVNMDEVSPFLFEEAVLLVESVSKSGPKWNVFVVFRSTTAGRLCGEWRKQHFPPLPWMREYSTRPTAPQLATFLQKTNFGLNEYGADVQILKVMLYRDWAELREVCSRALDSAEKIRRANAVFGFNARPIRKP